MQSHQVDNIVSIKQTNGLTLAFVPSGPTVTELEITEGEQVLWRRKIWPKLQ